MLLRVCSVVLLALVIHRWWIWQPHSGPSLQETIGDVSVHPKLLKVISDNEGFKPRLRKVCEGAYVTINQAYSTSMMIEAPEGLIIVDTTESKNSARAVLKAYREVSDKPIKAIMYTHHHRDHINGATVFIEDPSSPPEVWGHKDLVLSDRNFMGPTAQLMPYSHRSRYQYGLMLEEYQMNTIGAKFDAEAGDMTGFVEPTHLFDGGSANVTVAGMNLTLIELKGETDDGMGIWLPDKRLFACADNIHPYLVNLATVRYYVRNFQGYINVLDMIRRLQPEYLVPGHGPPLVGDEAYRLVTLARDAIQGIHDRTLKYISRGLTLSEIIEKIRFPKNIREEPYLHEGYAQLDWWIRGFYMHYMGWFNGDVTQLQPLTRTETAQQVTRMTGREKILEAARAAFAKGEYQWCLELTSYIFDFSHEDQEVLGLHIAAIKQLAAGNACGNARNYYMTEAAMLSGATMPDIVSLFKVGSILSLDMEVLFKGLPPRLQAEHCDGIKETLVFDFTDSKTCYVLTLRHSMLEVTSGEMPDVYDIKVTTTELLWREIMAKLRSPIWAYLTGSMTIEGGIQKFGTFMKRFDQDG